MKMITLIWGVSLLLSGALMIEQVFDKWVSIKDKKSGIKADFPHRPIEMTFETPFQNTPSIGQIQLYSAPIQTGVLVLTIFTSPTVTSRLLQKKEFYQFFEKTLVPYLFFNPSIFQDQQIFNYQSIQIQGDKGNSFQFFYQDHHIVKRIEGNARVKNHQLMICFYLASDQNFDQSILQHFLNSVQFSKNS